MSKENNPKDSIFKRFGGSLANAVENLIFSHEEIEEKPEKPAADKPASVSAPSAPVTEKVNPVKNISHKLVQTILESAEELGPALTNFKGYLDELVSIIPDEATRYKAAYATFSKSTKKRVADLIAAAQEQLDSLQNEKKDFMQGIREKAEDLNLLKQEMVNIDKDIKDLENRIQDLLTAKERKTAESKKLNTTIQNATERFEQALAAVEVILKEKRSKLEQYLKGM